MNITVIARISLVSIAAEAGAVALDEPGDPGSAAANRRRRSVNGRNQAMTAGSFLLPNMILVALFLLVPLVGTIIISFQSLASLGGAQFLGINNYTDLFQDQTFYKPSGTRHCSPSSRCQ